jgi:hypothetical protein
MAEAQMFPSHLMSIVTATLGRKDVGPELRALFLARQDLYYLSHTPIPETYLECGHLLKTNDSYISNYGINTPYLSIMSLVQLAIMVTQGKRTNSQD